MPRLLGLMGFLVLTESEDLALTPQHMLCSSSFNTGLPSSFSKVGEGAVAHVPFVFAASKMFGLQWVLDTRDMLWERDHVSMSTASGCASGPGPPHSRMCSHHGELGQDQTHCEAGNWPGSECVRKWMCVGQGCKKDGLLCHASCFQPRTHTGCKWGKVFGALSSAGLGRKKPRKGCSLTFETRRKEGEGQPRSTYK